MEKLKVCEIIGYPKFIDFNGRYAILTLETKLNNDVKINIVKNDIGELRSIRFLYGYTFKPKDGKRLPERIPEEVFRGTPHEQKRKFDNLKLNEIFKKYRPLNPLKFYTNEKFNVLINFIKHYKYNPKTIDIILTQLKKEGLLDGDWKMIDEEPATWSFVKNNFEFKDLEKIIINGTELSKIVNPDIFSNGKAKIGNGTNIIEIDCGELPMTGIKITGKKGSFSHDEDITNIINHIRNLIKKSKTASANDIFIHPSRDLIIRALKELGKTKASKRELILKIKEIVRQDGGVLVDDEIAWNEIRNLEDEKYN